MSKKLELITLVACGAPPPPAPTEPAPIPQDPAALEAIIQDIKSGWENAAGAVPAPFPGFPGRPLCRNWRAERRTSGPDRKPRRTRRGGAAACLDFRQRRDTLRGGVRLGDYRCHRGRYVPRNRAGDLQPRLLNVPVPLSGWGMEGRPHPQFDPAGRALDVRPQRRNRHGTTVKIAVQASVPFQVFVCQDA